MKVIFKHHTMSNREARMVDFIAGNGLAMKSVKKTRNAKCECNSGKKQKYCCGTETKWYHKPTTPEEAVETKNNKHATES